MSRLERLPIVEAGEADRSRIDTFWATLLGTEWTDDTRRRSAWLDSRRVHFLVQDEDRVLGNATLLRQPFLTSEGEPTEAGWITDFYVSPELKGRGMGKRLTRRLMEATPNPATFGQSEDARHCFSRLDWAGPAWVPLLAFSIPARRALCRVGLTIERSRADDPRVDLVWTGRGERSRPLGVRDVSALRSRLSGRPDAEYELWMGVDGPDPAGWVVLRSIRGSRNRLFGRVPVGILVDVFAVQDREDVLRELIRFALRRFARRGLAAVLAVETPGATGEVLRAEGFVPRVGIPGLRSRPLPRKGLMVAPGGIARLGLEPHLSFLDCDAELTF